MNRGGITLEFSSVNDGSFVRACSCHTDINICRLGSAVTTSAIIHKLISAMEKQVINCLLLPLALVIGPIIPPSGIMIIYAYVMGE